MYKIDDVVVYGNHGVCRITEITEKEFAGETHLYYTMIPVFDHRSTFFLQVDNEKSQKKIRAILTADEIRNLIRTIPQQEELKINDEKQRKDIYKTIIENGDRSEIMCLVKTLYERREAQKKAGRKQHLVDERFMKEAETVLYDEFAYVLNIDRDQVVEYIRQELK